VVTDVPLEDEGTMICQKSELLAQRQCHIPENLSSPFERLLDNVNAETKYTVLK
jgi:hypothetical protein